VRPYMDARMPHFGDEAVGHLVEAFLAVDANASFAPADSSTAPLSGADAIRAGHRLAGTTGLSCITCHTTAGQPSLGVPGMDLAIMHERLQPDWFRRWMDDPIALRDGTRMPSYFENGRSILGRILDGDATAQIDALWAWMSLGDALPLPEGVVVDRAAYDVVPVEQPAYVGTFMKGLSARVLAVGFPANVHLAYDGQHVRLARVWRGQFFDASGTWRGRAGQLVEPAGDAVQELPPGPSFALTDGYDDKGWMPSDSLTPWPDVGAQEADWRFLGHTRGPDGQPTFRSSWPRRSAEPKILVEETISPGLDEGGGHLVRSFDLQMAVGQRAPALRAAVSSRIEELPSAPDESRFRTAEGLTVLVRSANCRLRAMDTGTELLVVPHVFWPQIDDEPGRYPPRPKRAGFEVVLRW
jgi:hypothetical protein